MKNVICFHLLNGFSGSANILATVIDGLDPAAFHITLATSFDNHGFLSPVKCADKKNIPYVFSRPIVNRLFRFFRFQVSAVAALLKAPSNAVVYINTTLPFLPAVAAKLRGQAVVCHIHEAYPRKEILKKCRLYPAQWAADKIICVADYVRDELDPRSKEKAVVIKNALSPTFAQKMVPRPVRAGRRRILMISSARAYKGIFEFCRLATELGHYDFVLICDVSEGDVARIFRDYIKVPNLEILGTQTDLHRFYAGSDLIVNLSDPNRIVETFGLTILEGMSYGLPAIVPPVGGIAELVEDGHNGFRIDVNDRARLVCCIHKVLATDRDYARMSDNAVKKAAEYRPETLVAQVSDLLMSL